MTNLPTQEEVLEYFTSLSNWGRWGNKDELGTMNHITPKTRLRAAMLASEGVTVSCSRTLSNATGPDVTAQPLHYMVESGEGYAHDEKVGPPRASQTATDFFGVAFHGHTVTHIDSLSHFFFNGQMYNGRPSNLVSTRYGATVESIEVIQGGILARGVLLDIPRLRGSRWLEPGDGVLREELEAAEIAQGVHADPGDVLLVRTGQLRRRAEIGAWNITAEGGTGTHANCLPFYHERSIAVLGSDTGNSLVHPKFDKLANPTHQVGIVAMGLWILDNADLEGLAEACAQRGKWEFMMTINPLRIEGATGYPVNPIAVF
jgi:kynurenine formamidase